MLEENPDLQTPEFADEIRQMILDAVEMEEQYNRDLLPGGILGLNANYINQYVKYLADRRLEELGFEAALQGVEPGEVDGDGERHAAARQLLRVDEHLVRVEREGVERSLR